MAPAVEVQCMTCHRGARQPRMLQDVIMQAWEAGGADSAIATYRSLRQRFYGRMVYDFGEVPLADVAGSVAGQGRPADAERLLELNAEAWPESANVHDSLGEAYAASGDVERAVRSYERSLELNPGNQNAITKLRELRGRGGPRLRSGARS